MLNKKLQKQLADRLNRARGQLDGIRKMVEEPRYCIDILTQIAALRGALLSVGQFMLENHMKTCVSTAIKKGAGDREIKELIDVFRKF